MANHNLLGLKGENLAVEYLKRKKYQICSRNYRFGRLEIDIIAKKDNQLVVVEVKTRQNKFMSGPEITVTKSKQRSIIKVADFYIKEKGIILDTRFDIVSILLNKGEIEIEHLEDAFYPLI